MKSLVESLFDGDLVSKDTGYEYLYGLVTIIKLHSDFRSDYFDERKIKHDYNQLSRKFPPKDWCDNPLLSMKKIRNMEQDEIYRQLALIIVASIKTVNFTKQNSKVNILNMEKLVHDVIEPYTIGELLSR